MLFCKEFKDFFPPEVFTFISDNSFDFAFPPGKNYLTKEQKEYLSDKVGVPGDKVFNIKQVHGNTIVIAKKGQTHDETAEGLSPINEADGLVTNILGVPIAVRTADCLSVFLFDEKRKAIGIVHAGWRGTQQKIVETAISTMNKTYQTNPKDIKAAFGPAIRECCYQVSENMKQYFPQEIIKKNDKYFLDLAKVNKGQLINCGVNENNIYDSKVCTFCNHDYFSFRREGEKAGRMISVIMLKF